MVTRLRKRIGCCLLGPALVLGGGWVAWHHVLPSVMTCRLITAMEDGGLPGSDLRIHPPGLWQSRASELRTGTGSWRLQLDTATAHYQPLELLHARIDALDLAGLRLDWTPGRSGAADLPGDAVAPSTNALLAPWPDPPPLRRLTLSGGVLRIHEDGQAQVFNLAVGLTVTNHGALVHARLETPDQAAALGLDAVVAREGPTRGSVAFDVRDPTNWLFLAMKGPFPAPVQGLNLSPLSGTLTAVIPPGASVATVTGVLDRVELTFPAGRARIQASSATASVGRNGLVGGHLLSGLDLRLDSGTAIELPSVSVGLDDAHRLGARLEGFRLDLPEALQAEGDLRLTLDDVFDSASTTGRLGFTLRRFSLPGMVLEPFTGEVWGGAERLGFRLPDLTVPGFGRWHLSGLTGEVSKPFAVDARLEARGRVAGGWSSNLVADQALPFTIEARREGDRSTGTFSLSLTNVLLSALAGGRPARLSGSLAVGADLRTNRSEFSTCFDLSVPQVTGEGGSLDDLALSGEARLIRDAPARPPLPGLVLRFLPLLPGLTAESLADGRADVRGAVGRVSLDNGLNLEDVRLHLVRQPVVDGGTGAWARLEMDVAAVNWRGFRLSALQAVGSLEDERFHLEGSASVAGQPFPFQLDLRAVSAEPAAPDPILIGGLSLGPVRLVQYGVPHQWTGGDDVRITGDATIRSSVRMTPGGPWDAAPRLGLDLASVEWPARKLTVTGLRTALSLTSVNPLRSPPGEVIHVDRIAYEAWEVTNVTVGLAMQSDDRLQLHLVQADAFDGHVRSTPFQWDLRTGDFAASLEFEGVDLLRLSEVFPRWGGTLNGRLEGRVPLSRKAGQWRTSGGRLDLDRSVPARLHYPAQGLLTAGMAPGSPRYAQLRMVEEGLENLRLQAFTLEVCDPKTPGTPLRIHLEGTSASVQVILPVIFNLNFNGRFEEVLRLLTTGNYEWSF
ncbi:MAG: YdbH domain-containing protein [Verrucomicrobiales bacterium]|nr:YdbH domain-containing protein [Verrucomicrobiales bacterium]